MCVYVYVCMYVSDFAMSLITYPEDSVSTDVHDLTFEVSTKIFVCHVQVIIY